MRVYPRPRGEYVCDMSEPAAGYGLPPPTRGIRRRRRRRGGERIRSTPAHAGNTLMELDAAVNSAVYPRPRGEYWIAAMSAAIM